MMVTNWDWARAGISVVVVLIALLTFWINTRDWWRVKHSAKATDLDKSVMFASARNSLYSVIGQGCFTFLSLVLLVAVLEKRRLGIFTDPHFAQSCFFTGQAWFATRDVHGYFWRKHALKG